MAANKPTNPKFNPRICCYEGMDRRSKIEIFFCDTKLALPFILTSFSVSVSVLAI
jgi:hypothetical protein